MVQTNNSWFPLLGRIFIAALLLMTAYGKMAGFEASVGYAAAYGLPVANLAVLLALLIEGLGGLAILVGYKTKQAAQVVGLFLVIATLVFHTDFADQMQLMQFFKNFAIVGGLIFLSLHGAGELSMDEKKS